MAFPTVLAVSLAFDRAASAWAETLPNGVRSAAGLVTLLGTSGYMLTGSACVAAAAWLIGRGTQDGRIRAATADAFDRALLVFLAVAASGLAAQALKNAVGRSRPVFADTSGAFSFHPFAFRNAVASFPSGHTTSAFAAAVVLGAILPRVRPLLFLVAGVVGLSRVVVGAHYPSDVVSGAALGTGVALALARLSPGAMLASAARRKPFRLRGGVVLAGRDAHGASTAGPDEPFDVRRAMGEPSPRQVGRTTWMARRRSVTTGPRSSSTGRRRPSLSSSG